MTGTLNIDGKKAGNFIAQGMSGPNAGTTGFDIRTGHHGAMAPWRTRNLTGLHLWRSDRPGARHRAAADKDRGRLP